MWIQVLVLSVVTTGVYCQPLNPSVGDGAGSDGILYGGTMLRKPPTYLVVAPRKVRPGQNVKISATMLKLEYPFVTLRVSVRRGDFEEAYAAVKFETEGTRLMKMAIPQNAQPGNYSLRLEGLIQDLNDNNIGGGIVFANETELIFDAKQLSIFIQLDRPFYCQTQTVLFRVIPVTDNMKSTHTQMDVYVYDATGTVVRRWQSEQTNAGILSLSFEISDQPAYGNWSIEVEAYGYKYRKYFDVEENLDAQFYVDVSIPDYIHENGFGIAGIVQANHTMGYPVKGNGRVRLRVRNPRADQQAASGGKPGSSFEPTLERSFNFFEGVSSFIFTIDEIRQITSTSSTLGLTDKELHIEAEITDWFYQETQSDVAVAYVVSQRVRLQWLGDSARTFKPNQNFTVHLAAMKQDGTPVTIANRRTVSFELRQLAWQGFGLPTIRTSYEIPEDGIIPFEIEPHKDARIITLIAKYDNDEETRVEMRAMRYYSPSWSWVKITSPTVDPVVNEYMIFKIKTSHYVEFVYYQIVSSGNIVFADQLEMKSRQKTFSVALSQDMAPNARIIAFYIRPWDAEVVADSMNFFVNGSWNTDVKLRVNQGKDLTLDTVELEAETTPGSFVAFSASPRILDSKGGGTTITEDMIIEEMDLYDFHANISYKHQWNIGDYRTRSIYINAPSYAIDANDTFMFAGLMVFTDANVTGIPHQCNATTGTLRCWDGTCYSHEERCDRVANCPAMEDEMNCEYNAPLRYNRSSYNNYDHNDRYFDSGDWAWTEQFTKPDGKVNIRVPVPDTPIDYAISAFTISRDGFLGMVQYPIHFTATRPFYMTMEMPSRIIKGEQIGVRVGVFNYWTDYIEALVTLHASDSYRFVNVESMGRVSSYNPRTSSGDVQAFVYLFPNQVEYMFIPVLPLELGEVTVTISATCFMGSDTKSETVEVVMDGVTNFYHTPYLIDLTGQGSVLVPDFDIPVDQVFIPPEKRYHRYVPGSPKATLSMVGDIYGPGFFEPWLNSENLLRMPYGCGEQNMFNFAANYWTLKFLQKVNQLSDDTLQAALDNMNLIFQRQLSYMNQANGSFWMFRDQQERYDGSYDSSLWLTAFVGKTLSQVREGGREWDRVLFIPQDLLNRIAIWICDQQNITTGAFNNTGLIYDRKFESNFTEYTTWDGFKLMRQQNISLTAHVLIALTTFKDVTGVAKSRVSAAIGLAKRYLESKIQDLNDVYQIAIVAYALQNSGSEKREGVYQLLRSKAIRETLVYWARGTIEGNPQRIVQNVPVYEPRMPQEDEAYAVEATSYALLLHLENTLGDPIARGDSLAIMKWLQTMRNHNGGWASTQDSIMAMQALYEYASKDTNRDLYNLKVTVEATSTPSWSRVFSMTKENWGILQTVDIPNVWGSARVIAKGTGLALLQLDTQVNVEFPFQLRKPAVPNSFDLWLPKDNGLIFSGKNFSIMNMVACAQWRRTDLAPASGMSVMEIHIPSGYIVPNDLLYPYGKSGALPNLRRAEFYDGKAVFYFDYINASNPTCIQFEGRRWWPVANMTIQHKMRVYDYYDPNNENTTLYETYALFNLHICMVCGSFQCPYCPFFNLAPVAHASLTIIVLSFSMFIMKYFMYDS